MQLSMINDKIVAYEDLDPVYLDRGTYFGDGVYEVVRSYNGKLFALDDHLRRFDRSLAEIGINNVDTAKIRRKVLDIFEKAQIPDAKIYFHITRGSQPRSHTSNGSLVPNFFLTITELPDYRDKKANGISVSTYPDLRWKRCDIKSLNLLANVMAMQDAENKGCDEAILVNGDGLITEGAGSCFFAVFGNTVRTTSLKRNILPSITRKFALRAVENIGMKIDEAAMTPNQAAGADELFIAVTTRDIVPVVKFDGKIITGGKPGTITNKLIREFSKFTM